MRVWHGCLFSPSLIAAFGATCLRVTHVEFDASASYELQATTAAISMFIMARQHLPPLKQALGGLFYLCLMIAMLCNDRPLSNEQESRQSLGFVLILFVSNAIGRATNHEEKVLAQLQVKLALQPAHDALRLVTWERGQLAPTITWDRVQLRNPIGAGVFGTVHTAKYAGSSVAAKVIHVGKATPDFLVQECKLMLTLRHPNVLTTLGLVSDGQGRHAILMELMEASLLTLLEGAMASHLSWHNSLTTIALQVAQGMSYLHERHVIHGDLKPANVLLRGTLPEVQVKLCDFGEAKRIEQSPAGQGQLREISRRSDVWSFGGLLAHLEHRTPPFNPAPPMTLFMDVMAGKVSCSWPLGVQQLALNCVFGGSRSALQGLSISSPEGIKSPCTSPTQEVDFEVCVLTLNNVSVELGIAAPLDSRCSSNGSDPVTRMPYLITPSPYLHNGLHATASASGWAGDTRLEKVSRIMRRIIESRSPYQDSRRLASSNASPSASVLSSNEWLSSGDTLTTSLPGVKSSKEPSVQRVGVPCISKDGSVHGGASTSREGSVRGGMLRRRNGSSVDSSLENIAHLATEGARSSKTAGFS